MGREKKKKGKKTNGRGVVKVKCRDKKGEKDIEKLGGRQRQKYKNIAL